MSTQLDIPNLLEQFHQEGFLVLPEVLPKAYVAELLAGVQDDFSCPNPTAEMYGGEMGQIWRPLMFEHGEAFERLIDFEPVIDLVQAIVGEDCHIIANSALRTGPGQGISGWHADEVIRFPRPKGVPLDPRIPMPCFVLNLNYYLCDVDEPLGPTEFVPGSHRSGRQIEPTDFDSNGEPSYEGRGVFRGVGPAGTVVMWNDQTWHRGAKNRTTDRIRWVQQAPYGRRFISQRFYPFVNYHMPEEILERANPRRKSLLGLHSIGAYG